MPTRVRVSLSDPDPVDVEARGTGRAHQCQSRSIARAAPARVTFTLHLSNTSTSRNKHALPRPNSSKTHKQHDTHCARGGGRTCARATRPGPRPPARPHIAPGAPRLDTHVCAVRHGQRAPTLDKRALSSVARLMDHTAPLFPILSPPRARLTLPPRCILSLSPLVISPPHTCDVAALASGRPRVGRVAHEQRV